MPKKPDYSQSKIYKLRCKNTGQVYIGSTTTDLDHRLQTHESDYRRYTKNGKYHYVSSFDIIRGSNYTITQLEAHPCSSRKELMCRERHWIERYSRLNYKLVNRKIEASQDSCSS